uniref:Uncharacterized protein n=1 Tax=Rhizophora mucronata TaxID=61149 RepID=A0A2P2P8W0_RHIMU
MESTRLRHTRFGPERVARTASVRTGGVEWIGRSGNVAPSEEPKRIQLMLAEVSASVAGMVKGTGGAGE